MFGKFVSVHEAARKKVAGCFPSGLPSRLRFGRTRLLALNR